jgi:hypothetical protein
LTIRFSDDFLHVCCLSAIRCTLHAARCTLLILSSVTLVLAQAPEGKPKALDAVQKQIPTDPKAAAEQAEFLAKNVPAAPLPAGSAPLDALRARAADIQKQHAQYLADIAAAKTIPHAHLHETLPQRTQDLKALTLSLEQIKTEADPAKKQLLSKAFFAALQPIGSYLETAAANSGYVNRLTDQLQAELTRLEQAWEAADKEYETKNQPLHFVGPGQLYTITSLSVPIILQAPPSSKVIFQTFGGGFFPNQLALIEVQANAAGIAATEWVSYGDSIGDTVIGVRSKAAPPAANLTVTTVQLLLSPLPELPTQLPSAPATAPIKTPDP